MNAQQKSEDEFVAAFKRQGFRARKAMGENEPAGDWIIKIGNKTLNLSALAKEIDRSRTT